MHWNYCAPSESHHSHLQQPLRCLRSLLVCVTRLWAAEDEAKPSFLRCRRDSPVPSGATSATSILECERSAEAIGSDSLSFVPLAELASRSHHQRKFIFQALPALQVKKTLSPCAAVLPVTR